MELLPSMSQSQSLSSFPSFYTKDGLLGILKKGAGAGWVAGAGNAPAATANLKL